jgi:hypothetical protein
MTTTKANTVTQSELVQRVRGRKGDPIGVLVAKDIGNNLVGVGWSLCSVKVPKGKKADKFDFELGKNIAGMRAADPVKYLASTRVPQSITSELIKFGQRCRKYFKEHTVIDFNRAAALTQK